MSEARLCANGCGRRVSANKDTCFVCADDVKTVSEAKERPIDATKTHILVRHKTVDQTDLYRIDGLIVASQQKDLVRFGSDISTAQNRLFFNAETARAWLRRLADVDLHAAADGVPLHTIVDTYPAIDQKATFDEHDLEKEAGLVLPAARRIN